MKVFRNNLISKLTGQKFLRFSTASEQSSSGKTNKTTVDFQDVMQHSKYSENWWDSRGETKALHSLNPLRVKFVRDGLANTGFQETNPSRPLEGIKLLDVGCGGGILSEPLARIGANVTGLDASKELISIAKEHAELDKDLANNLNYVNTTIEDFSEEKKEEFDAIVASEILEHVIDKDLFIKCCSSVLKPKGSIFITTLNKNIISWLGGIVAAEYILKLLPMGTHDWNKFISPEETRQLLEKHDCKTKLIHGMLYNPITNEWSWTSSTVINYAIHAVKTDTARKEN